MHARAPDPAAPQVAVVIPAHDPGPLLVESVASVLAQRVDLELVVVDDGSSPQHMPELPRDPRLRIVRQQNLGVSAARNRGARETSAPLVAFLDADDRWIPDKLELQIAALERDPATVLCHTGFSLIDREGRPLGPGWAAPAGGYLALLGTNPVAMSSAVVRRSDLDRAGGFDPFYSIVADWDLWLRLAALGPFAFVAEALVEYRLAPHGEGQMSGDPLMAYREAISVLERHELRARRHEDAAALDAIARARRRAAQVRAEQAAARFVDSVGSRDQPEWSMATAAVRIDAGAAARTATRRAGRRLRHLRDRGSVADSRMGSTTDV